MHNTKKEKNPHMQVLFLFCLRGIIEEGRTCISRKGAVRFFRVHIYYILNTFKFVNDL